MSSVVSHNDYNLTYWMEHFWFASTAHMDSGLIEMARGDTKVTVNIVFIWVTQSILLTNLINLLYKINHDVNLYIYPSRSLFFLTIYSVINKRYCSTSIIKPDLFYFNNGISRLIRSEDQVVNTICLYYSFFVVFFFIFCLFSIFVFFLNLFSILFFVTR